MEFAPICLLPLGKSPERRTDRKGRTLKIRAIMLRVTDVDYLKDYSLALTFSNHEKRIVDLRRI